MGGSIHVLSASAAMARAAIARAASAHAAAAVTRTAVTRTAAALGELVPQGEAAVVSIGLVAEPDRTPWLKPAGSEKVFHNDRFTQPARLSDCAAKP